MAVRYLGRDARITDSVIESRQPIYQCFAIHELDFIHIVRADTLAGLAASTPVRVCSAGATGIAGILATAGWPMFHNVPFTAGGVAALAIAVGAVMVARRARRQPLEIRAVHRGQLVCLFSTTNRHTLGQVSRALLRVLEDIEDAR